VRVSIRIQELSPVAMAAFHKMSLSAAEHKDEPDEFIAEDEEVFLDEDDINVSLIFTFKNLLTYSHLAIYFIGT